MQTHKLSLFFGMFTLATLWPRAVSAQPSPLPGGAPGAVVTLVSPALTPTGGAERTLRLDGLFYRTAAEQVWLLPTNSLRVQAGTTPVQIAETTTADGHTVRVAVKPEGNNFTLTMTATPSNDIIGWGLGVQSTPDEYFTGMMEQVVDGPQAQTWRRGINEAMNLRGQRIEMLVKPTLSIFTPFYLSSRGYSTAMKGTWPGSYDFCNYEPLRVWVQFEGPTFEMKVSTSDSPAELVRAHALETGPPILPPKWMYMPWRWRDEHTQRPRYYDGTPVTGPFNSESMEDILMMNAFGIPCGVYWIDRPWGPGVVGYDDFDIDPVRMPNFAAMVKWINEQNMQMVLWIGPFWNGQMGRDALAKGYNLPGQPTTLANGQVRPPAQNFPLADFSNPAAKANWQEGVAKLLKLGVAGFKLDRAEELIPDDREVRIADGRTMREQRNDYPLQYLKATYEVAQKYRGEDFALMPRAAYTGSTRYGVFWGGDIGGVPEGLRASVIAVQRSAVLGYPNWGSDTGGYNAQSMNQDMVQRWLGFSAFCPIMEVGPTRNLAFWSLNREPNYDAPLIATWRLYARLHARLVDYSYAQAKTAHESGMPIVRPLFLSDPKAAPAWANWWTYQYGPDIVVSPIWETGQRTQEVYLPAGNSWKYAWNGQTYAGGQTVVVGAEVHQIPFFTRVGSTLPIGDLAAEWSESVTIAAKAPDLRPLDAGVKAWFEKYQAANPGAAK